MKRTWKLYDYGFIALLLSDDDIYVFHATRAVGARSARFSL